ncbi:MAG: hypothetical protein K2W99_04210 [Chthoniobacterales bacterium]|nr:hypothetical protein [Chthoniobacterales bacterium]
MSLGKKILGGSIVLFGAFFFIVWYLSRTVTEDLSNQFPYSQSIGKHFVLAEDMYLFKDRGSSQLSIAGSHSGINGLPYLVSEKCLQDYGGDNQYLKVYGIIKKGSIFTVEQVVEERTFESSFLEFIIDFHNSSLPKKIFYTGTILNWKYYPFTQNLGDPPIFDPRYALPLPADGIWWK